VTELVTPPQTVDPTPNLPLLRKVLGHIDNHPREWNQSTWGMQTQSETACSTAHCVAGWAVVFDGTHDVTYSPHSGRMRIDGQQEILAHPVSGGHLRCYAAAFIHGRNALGLTDSEATRLFQGNNERYDIQRIAETIANRAGEKL